MFYLFFFRTFVKVEEGDLHIFGESRRENVLCGAKLMPTLPDDGVYHIKAGNFVLGPAFLDEFLHALYDVLVVFDGANGALCDGRHFRLRNRRLDLVQRRELQKRKSAGNVMAAARKLHAFLTSWLKSLTASILAQN